MKTNVIAFLGFGISYCYDLQVLLTRFNLVLQLDEIEMSGLAAPKEVLAANELIAKKR
jgi:hypothetical protein